MAEQIKTKISFKKVSRKQLNELIACLSGISYDLTETELNKAIDKALLTQVFLKLNNYIHRNQVIFTIGLQIAEALVIYKYLSPYVKELSPFQYSQVIGILTQIEKELL